MKIGAFSNDTKRFITSLREEDFRGLIVVPLLEAMGWKRVRVTHGSLEFGKDIVFQSVDKLDGLEYRAVVVKVGPVTGDASSSSSARTIFNQLQQCFDTPVLQEDGSPCSVSRAYLITNHSITEQAKQSIAGALRGAGGRVRFFDLEALLDLVQEHCPELLASQNTALADHLQRDFDSNCFVRHLHILGSKRRIPLYQCYSGGNLDLVEAHLLNKTSGIPIEEALASHPYILICGGPGSGKSTLLQRLILDHIADNKVRPRKTVALIPILVPLRTISQEDVKNRGALLHFFTTGLGQLLHQKTALEGVAGVFLLLDGVDEIFNAKCRSDFLELVATLPKTRSLHGLAIKGCIVTSRTYAARHISGFTTAFLRPHSKVDVRHFGERWFLGSPEVAAHFNDFLTGRQDVFKLAQNPLLLTLMAVIFERSPKELKATRSAIYSKAIQILSHDWDAERAMDSPYTLEEVESFMTYIAVEMMETHLSGAADAQVAKCSALLRNESILHEPINSVAEVAKRYERNPLLCVNGQQSLEFSHNCIKEFLVARHYRETRKDHRLIAHADNDEWWNVIGFYFGILRKIELADEALLKAIRRHPTLGLMCIVEADRSAHSMRQALTREIILGLASGECQVEDEVLPMLHAVGEYALSMVDELLDSRARVNCWFYVALNDLLCDRVDKQSQGQLRRAFNLLTVQNLSAAHVDTLAHSYLASRNPAAAELLSRLYALKDLQLNEAFSSKNEVRNLNRGKREVIEKMRGDRQIILLTEELARLASETVSKGAEFAEAEREIARSSRSARPDLEDIQKLIRRKDECGRALDALRVREKATRAELESLGFSRRIGQRGVVEYVRFLCRRPLALLVVRRVEARMGGDFRQDSAKAIYSELLGNVERSAQHWKECIKTIRRQQDYSVRLDVQDSVPCELLTDGKCVNLDEAIAEHRKFANEAALLRSWLGSSAR